MTLRRLSLLLLVPLAACAGSAGLGGKNALILLATEPAGTHCASGGVAIETGLDTNGNGTLEASEVDATRTQYVCNGATGGAGGTGGTGPTGSAGDAGPSGQDALVKVTPEPKGAGHCTYGGQRIDVGIDTNHNGVLDSGEITSTTYLCEKTSPDAFIFGDVYITNVPDQHKLDGVQVVIGNIFFQGQQGTAIVFPELLRVTGTIDVTVGLGGSGELRGGSGAPSALVGLASISFPALLEVARINVVGQEDLTEFTAPSLTQIDDTLYFDNNPKLAALSLPALKSMHNLYLYSNSLLTTLSLPALGEIRDSYDIWNNQKLDQCAAYRFLGGLVRRPTNVNVNSNDTTNACVATDTCLLTPVPGMTGAVRWCVQRATFADAETTCASLGAGAYLVWFESEAEHEAFKTAAQSGVFSSSGLWTGYSDQATENAWVPTSGFAFTFGPTTSGYWGSGEPNGARNENCAEMFDNGLLNDISCTNNDFPICRVP